MIKSRSIAASLFVALSLFAALPAPAAAQDKEASGATSRTVRSGQTLRTADGRQLGQINRVDFSGGGEAGTASVIVDDRLVYIPISTITTSPKGPMTSLSFADVRKLH